MDVKRYPTKQQVSFKITSFTLSEIKRLSKELDTNMSAIVELAVSRFAFDQRRGI